ncbi:MAG: ribosome assembly RNA-binding protein YhbY [Cellvibrionaceae bacterium]
MTLSSSRKKELRAIGHKLNPVVIVSENGLSEGVLAELERALEDHELIKVKFALPERDDRKELIDAMIKETRAELAQTIGKIALIFRPAKKPNPKLSNLTRI